MLSLTAAGKMNNWLDWYVAPEFMMKDVRYDYKVDIWSFGVMFASLITRQMPLFRGSHA